MLHKICTKVHTFLLNQECRK